MTYCCQNLFLLCERHVVPLEQHLPLPVPFTRIWGALNTFTPAFPKCARWISRVQRVSRAAQKEKCMDKEVWPCPTLYIPLGDPGHIMRLFMYLYMSDRVRPSQSFYFDHGSVYSQSITDISEDIPAQEQAVWYVLFLPSGHIQMNDDCARVSKEKGRHVSLDKEHGFMKQILHLQSEACNSVLAPSHNWLCRWANCLTSELQPPLLQRSHILG